MDRAKFKAGKAACRVTVAGAQMNTKRRETTYLLRIWQEPSDLAPPGEWRGVLRSLDGQQEWLFKSAQELWDLLTRGEAPTQTGKEKPEIPC